MPSTMVRGNYVRFTATFLDDQGAQAEPVSANLYVSYILNNASRLDTVAMAATATPSIWEAIWNSDGVQVSPVQWSVKALDPSGRALVQDGLLDLSANAANQQGVHA